MNVKETMELINYLKDRQADLTGKRDYYANEIEDHKDGGAISGYVESCEERREKASTELTLVSYFIRELEQIEVTR